MAAYDCVPLDCCALFLDFDGTLAPLAETPSAVAADPNVNALLRRFQAKLDGRLAIISGRPIADIDRLVDEASPYVAGVHGLQRRSDGHALMECEPHPMLRDATAVLTALARAQPGVLVETKPQSTAVHYRMAPRAEAALVECAERLAKASGLVLQRGAMVIELCTPGADKGAAVRAFMAEDDFLGAIPIYVGDDLSDEAAFEAANGLGGFGVLVGEARSTAARYRLSSPPQVLDWLTDALDQRCFSAERLSWAG